MMTAGGFGINAPSTTLANPVSFDLKGAEFATRAEVDDARSGHVVHFGDIGQEQLTPEQLDALGQVDIALTQFVNSYSQMSVGNKKGFNLMAQVKPRLIIPTHGGSDMDAIQYAMELWDVVAADASEVSVGRSDLSEGTEVLVMGEMAPAMKKIYDLPAW